MSDQQKKHEMLKWATTMVADIDYLSERPEFNRFMDGLRRRADALADEVLHQEELTPEQREAKRQFRLGIMEVLGAPKMIREQNFALLKKNGALEI